MIPRDSVNGMRVFLFCLLQLIKEGKCEKCSFVENEISNGIASAICKKYPKVFESYEFNIDHCEAIDEYYKKFIGISDGNEIRKYCCEDDDGLYLIIKIALNEF